jgi:hypothetical protein
MIGVVVCLLCQQNMYYKLASRYKFLAALANLMIHLSYFLLKLNAETGFTELKG